MNDNRCVEPIHCVCIDSLTMKPPSVIERYFQCRYRADSHPILTEKKCVSSIDFDVAGGNRLAIRVSGKGKKGAQSVKPESVLCKVTCDDDSSYLLRCCVKGQLIEVNENLCRSPRLLTEKPKGTGYIAIILPYLKSFEEDMKKLKTADEYQLILKERSQTDANSVEPPLSS